MVEAQKKKEVVRSNLKAAGDAAPPAIARPSFDSGVLRRSRGDGEIAEVEVWMDWRMECRVLRQSGVDSEGMELMQR